MGAAQGSGTHVWTVQTTTLEKKNKKGLLPSTIFPLKLQSETLPKSKTQLKNKSNKLCDSPLMLSWFWNVFWWFFIALFICFNTLKKSSTLRSTREFSIESLGQVFLSSVKFQCKFNEKRLPKLSRNGFKNQAKNQCIFSLKKVSILDQKWSQNGG